MANISKSDSVAIIQKSMSSNLINSKSSGSSKKLTQSRTSLLAESEKVYEIKENKMQKVTLPEIGKVSNEPISNHEGLKRVYVPKPKKATSNNGI